MRAPRPFGKMDIVILLAFLVAAVAAAAWRDVLFDVYEWPRAHGHAFLDSKVAARRPEWVWSLFWPWRRVSSDLEPFLVIATVGVGTVLVRRPHLLRGRDWPAPGVVVGAVGTIVVAYCLVMVILSLGSSAGWARVLQRRFFSTFFLIASGAVQGSILGAWTILAVARRWRPKSDDWDDRLGRLLGWAWFARYGCSIVEPAIWT